MAGWHSLSGYLYSKPTGAFSRFKTKKKQWYIFEESRSQLLIYRTQSEARSPSAEPIGAINIKNASISLNLEEQNQFIINSEGKEFCFQAENHESMMIWLIGLQAKREASLKEQKDPERHSPRKLSRRSKTCEFLNTRVSEPVVSSLSSGFNDDHSWKRTSSCKNARRGSEDPGHFDTTPRLGRKGRGFLTSTDTLSVGADSSYAIEEEDADDEWVDILDSIQGKKFRDLKLSLSASFTTGLSKAPHVVEMDEEMAGDEEEEATTPPQLPCKRAAATSESDGDEVFNYDALLEKHDNETPKPSIHHTELVSTGCESHTTNSMDSGIAHKEERNESLSDDSAIDRESDQRTRHLQLELLKTKEELASTVNRETCLRELLERRETTISELDEKVSRLEQFEKALTQRDRQMLRDAILRSRRLARPNTISLLARVFLHQMEELRARPADLGEAYKACKQLKVDRQRFFEILYGVDTISVNLTRARPPLPCFPDERSVTDALTRTMDHLKSVEEQCRVFQNQNRFLNEEVKKLTNMRYTDQAKIREHYTRIRELELEIERWKRDYVFLLQSNITVPTGDVMDGFELNLYGGNRHRERLKELLEEARDRNPGLPTFEKLNQTAHHVDRYGFKHTHENESLLLHYICRQLHEHYESQLARHEEHQLAWRAYLKQHRNTLQKTKELKALCRAGVPAQYRNEVWRLLIHDRVKDVIQMRGQHYYNNIINQIPESEIAGIHRKQISLDLLRTLPTNIHFDQNDADGIKKLQEVLQAFTIHNPNIGYCQGMNFIAGMALLFLDKEDAFWCLVALSEKYFPPHYFNSNLVGAQADQLVLKELVKEKLPQLHQHLQSIDIDIATITLNWFLAVFFDAVPFETLVRIWDCFLLEGPKVLFRFALAILQIHERILLQQKDTISVWKHLKLAAKLTFDVEGFIKTAFEEVRPFIRRKDITAKQTCFMNAFKDFEKSKEMKRKFYQDAEDKLRELDRISYHRPLIECITAYDNGKLWLCHGEQNSARICMINCEDSLMYDLSCEFDSRIMAICGLNPEVVLLGSLSMNLYAFSTATKEKIWQTRLHDSILELTVCYGEERKTNKVFAALADGTIAVLENVSAHEPTGNIFYIFIGFSPVTSLLLVGQELWCACSNTVQILNASTLDHKEHFIISNNPLDHILCLKEGMHGVWVAVKGSSIIELWDERTLTCKLLFDVKENRYVRTKRDEDTYFNPQRVTSILPFNNTVWVGAGNGDLSVFEVICKTGFLSRSNSLRACRPAPGRKFSIEEKVSKFLYSTASNTANGVASSRSGLEDNDATPTTSPRHRAPYVLQDGPIDQGVRAPPSPKRGVPRMSRSTQTPGQLLQREIIINKKASKSEEPSTPVEANGRIFEMNLNEEMVRKNSEGLHLEIFLQMKDEASEKETSDKCVSTEEPPEGVVMEPSTIFADVHPASEDETDVSHADASEIAESEASEASAALGAPAATRDEGKLTPIIEDAEQPTCYDESVRANHSRAPSESALSTPSGCHDERTSEGFSSCEETTFSEAPKLLKTMMAQPSSSNSKTSEQPTPDAEALYDHELILLVKNKVSESPIRCLIQTVSEGEPVIVSCSGRFEEDEAVLKWKRVSYENKIWTNEPVFQVCQQTQTVQLPAYMKHRLSMSSSDDK